MGNYQFDKKAEESIGKKLNALHGFTEPEERVESIISYDKAKEDGNVKAMLANKLTQYREKKSGLDNSVIDLSQEYYSTLSIGDIQSRLHKTKALVDKAKDTMDRIYKEELDKITKHYQKTIGGLQDEELARCKAIEAAKEQVVMIDEYKEAFIIYGDSKKEYTALKNAKEMYIEDNMDLINAEKERVRKEELLASGILEEMGLAPDKENS